MEQLGNTYEDRFTDPDDQAEPALAFTADALGTGAKGGKAPVAFPEVEDVDLSKPLAPTHDENKGFMRFMPALIKEMNRKGVPFSLDGGSGEITIKGFYKNGAMKLEFSPNDDIVAIDKNGKRKVMTSFDALVKLNYDWWRRSTGRGELLSPDRPWLDEFLEKGWVKRQVIFVPRDEQGPGEDAE
ncbi:TPA: hypothetical protein QDB15_000093 [Burkholderia vietnamiensis]|uniref:Uncharacterized protein n=1 Tax=Pandoraea apista TaxID=93218 RepID=A0A5E5P1D8_9BURK|nr:MULTISPECIES: hypothetical protein [Burkholderiaceae]MCA8206367.1 hypothetical protein [Burkholderia vietnamiensis]VVG70362.1 hypothetical protein PAP18089_01322 [Pandoraea apista]HDR8943165.1 hypothetical protein [Burkholderia vietnamiensis]HDR9116369.1 hypothetical protein [Burkholderia vietnamiensis]HDR9205415.1 hypothetical protein [Burkholderia vietnamiensis]